MTTGHRPCTLLTALLALAASASAQTSFDWRRIHERGRALRATADSEAAAIYAYDIARDVVVGLGDYVETYDGQTRTSYETHERHGTRWLRSKPATMPARGAKLVYDDTMQRVRAWDGRALWDWDGRVWSSIPSTGGTTNVGALIYDLRNKQLLNIVNDSAAFETWGWTGTAWQKLDTRAPWTTRIVPCHSAYFDVYVFDGAGASKVRRWDGTTWHLDLDAPPGRVLAAATDTSPWILTQRTPTSLPQLEAFDPFSKGITPVPGGTIAIDDSFLQSSGEISLFKTTGELVLASTRIDTHDGHAWRQRFATHGALAHDPLRDRAICVSLGLFGKAQTNVFEGRTWRTTSIKTPYVETLVWMPSMRAVVAFHRDAAWALLDDEWRQIPSAQSLPTWIASATVDERTRTAVFVLGNQETWEWDVRRGYHKTHAAYGGPSTLGYDRARNVRVLISKWNSSPTARAIHEWNNGAWTLVARLNSNFTRTSLRSHYMPELGGLASHGLNWFTGNIHGKIEVWDGKTMSIAAAQTPDATPQSVLRYYDRLRRRLVVLEEDDHYEFGRFALAPHVSALRPGDTWTVTHDDAGFAGRALVLAFSDRLRPVLPLRVDALGDVEVLPIGVSPVLDASVQMGLVSVVDAQGRASFQLPIPKNTALVGLELFAAGVYVGPNGIEGATNDVALRVTR